MPVRRGGGGYDGCNRTPLLEVKTIFPFIFTFFKLVFLFFVFACIHDDVAGHRVCAGHGEDTFAPF